MSWLSRSSHAASISAFKVAALVPAFKPAFQQAENGKSKSLLLSNLIYILAGLGLTEAKGKEVKCICKDENGKVAKVQMLPWPFTSCISFLWLGDLQQQKLILSQFWILEGQHQFHGVKTPLPGVGWAELPLGLLEFLCLLPHHCNLFLSSRHPLLCMFIYSSSALLLY